MLPVTRVERNLFLPSPIVLCQQLRATVNDVAWSCFADHACVTVAIIIVAVVDDACVTACEQDAHAHTDKLTLTCAHDVLQVRGVATVRVQRHHVLIWRRWHVTG